MSSGNPFRRSIVQDASSPSLSHSILSGGAAAISVDGSGSEAYQIDSEPPSSEPRRKSKTKKHVRITSPPHSPQPTSPAPLDAREDWGTFGPHENYPQQRRGSRSPPPPISPEEVELRVQQAIESAETIESEEDAVVIENTRRNSASFHEDQGLLGAPPNPFERTLAMIEPSSKPEPAERESSVDKSGPRPGKASMDVDSFKRLLMTGSATPTSSGPLPQSTAKVGLQPDNGSSTDTSSISHASIFEPIPELNPSSPRSSYELSISDDDDRAGLIEEGPPPPKKDKKKPPPPKHRHGKGLAAASRAPQTVSFFDFQPTFSSSGDDISGRPLSGVIDPTQGPRRVTTDLNKPLPPNPPAPTTPPVLVDSQIQQSAPTADAGSDKQRKAPPPPPVTRRHSMLKSSNASTRSRSNSSLSTVSQPPSDAPPSSVSAELQNQRSPPPPPTRRLQPTTSLPLSPPILESGSDPHSGNDSISELTRTPSLPPNQASSIHSSSIITSYPSESVGPFNESPSEPPKALSPSSTSTIAPPPPPPPRRSNRASRGNESPSESPRSSMDISRPSQRRTSAASATSSLRKEVGLSQDIAEAADEIEAVKDKLAVQQSMLTEATGEAVRKESSAAAVDGKPAAVDDFLKGLDDLQKEIDAIQAREAAGGRAVG